MTSSQHGTVKDNKRRTEIMDLLKWKQIDFLKEPTRTKADELRALRDEQSDIEVRIVQFVVNRKLFDMMLADAVAEANAEDIELPDYEESPSAY